MDLPMGGPLERPVFTPEFYRELASESPFGFTVTRQEAEAWFNYIAWPAYKTYHYKLHHKAVRRWWSRCSVRDLKRACEAMEDSKMECAQVEQNELTALENEELTSENKTVLRGIFGVKRD